ncbi:unnamed protein product [Sphagnum jensenii]|uniref:Uncharacterized protein n=1 Tax=Sphagnum jensenii TaxID=128206 RepID=A0ABP1AQ19_9BRYO
MDLFVRRYESFFFRGTQQNDRLCLVGEAANFCSNPARNAEMLVSGEDGDRFLQQAECTPGGSYISITFESDIMEDNPDQEMSGISVIIC